MESGGKITRQSTTPIIKANPNTPKKDPENDNPKQESILQRIASTLGRSNSRKTVKFEDQAEEDKKHLELSVKMQAD